MKIAIIGYGKMGHEVERIALSRGHEVVARVDEAWSELPKADVVIEFTTPTTAVTNILQVLALGLPIVSGTTGWIEKSWAEVSEAVKECDGTLFYASNFSLGVYLFRQLNRYLAKLLAPFEDYTPSMEEIHHIHKLDYPSGTALTLATEFIESYGKALTIEATMEEQATKIGNLPIHCKREGEVPGTHRTRFRSEVDQITIEHEAFGRSGFALGAVLAAEFTVGKKGILTMDHLFADVDKDKGNHQ